MKSEIKRRAVQGDPKAQLRERHDASDFDLRTEDKLAAGSA